MILGGEVTDGVGDEEWLDVVGERIEGGGQYPDVSVDPADDELVAALLAQPGQQIRAVERAVAPLGENLVRRPGREFGDDLPVAGVARSCPDPRCP